MTLWSCITRSCPVGLGGLFLSEEPSVFPRSSKSFRLVSSVRLPRRVHGDNNPAAGNLHLNFRLAAEQGQLALIKPDLTWIDYIQYGPKARVCRRAPAGRGVSIRLFRAGHTDAAHAGGPNPGQGPGAV